MFHLSVVSNTHAYTHIHTHIQTQIHRHTYTALPINHHPDVYTTKGKLRDIFIDKYFIMLLLSIMTEFSRLLLQQPGENLR